MEEKVKKVPAKKKAAKKLTAEQKKNLKPGVAGEKKIGSVNDLEKFRKKKYDV